MQLFIAIGICGFVGAVSRHFMALLFNNSLFPWGTLTVNLLGSFLLGFFLTIVLIWFEYGSSFVIAISVGIIGSFTTFSTLCVDLVKLLTVSPSLALVYISASFFGGLLLVAGGRYLGRQLVDLIAGDSSSKEAK